MLSTRHMVGGVKIDFQKGTLGDFVAMPAFLSHLL
jgi:hypothetical protein